MGWRWSGVAVPGPFQHPSSEVTSGIPDNSRDPEGREAERHHRDLHSRSTAAEVEVLWELTMHEARGCD